MRNLLTLDQYRIHHPILGSGDHECGFFIVPNPGGDLRVMASSGEGWDHVSVSLVHRCPNWGEMERVKRLFFRDDETAMQLHVPPADHVNHHPYCLHLWRPLGAEIPRPPADMVGPVLLRERA